MSYLLVQTVIVHISDQQLLWNFVVQSQRSHWPQAVQSILTHPLPYSAHLCCSADSQGQGKAWRFAGQIQHWAFLVFQLAIGWYCPREIWQRLWQEVCDILPLGALSLNGLYLFRTGLDLTTWSVAWLTSHTVDTTAYSLPYPQL